MPNWCKGDLKVRGTKENLTKFILEGLHPVNALGERKRKLELDEFGDVHTNETCWIENTHRGFAIGVDVYISEFEDNEMPIAVFASKFAWGIDAEQLLQICKKYNVDMKIYAFERGMEFNQEIEIVNGEIVKDEEIHFEDYGWDCICPELGG